MSNETCSNCDGTGVCPECDGTGDCELCGGEGCENCQGSGLCEYCADNIGKCNECDGTGVVPVKDEIFNLQPCLDCLGDPTYWAKHPMKVRQ